MEAKLATVPPPLPEPKKRKLIGRAPKTPTDTSTNTDSTSDADCDTETHKDSDSSPKKKTKLTKGVENTEEPVSATKTNKKAAQITAIFTTCGCKKKKEARNKLKIAKKNGLKNQKLLVRSIAYLRPEKIPEFCWNHLRDFCTVVGLKTQVGRREELMERLEKLWKRRYELGKMTTEPETKDWFTMPLRGRVLEEKLGSLRFMPTPHEKHTFDPAVVMQRYVDAETIKEWDRDGTTIVRGVINWLLEDPEILELIEHEVRMYMHHRKMIGGRKNFGWLRSAYYAQIQQIARQDRIYYALLAATSEEMWQFLYPYYMKATLPGDGIAFQHVDLNVTRYIECGRGERRIQSSFTLNQETDINCTLVIPRFHKHIRNWWNEAINRESTAKLLDDHSTKSLKTRKLFLLSDKMKYGDFVPAVCGPGDIRLSRAEIIHGSNFNKVG